MGPQVPSFLESYRKAEQEASLRTLQVIARGQERNLYYISLSSHAIFIGYGGGVGKSG